MHIYSYYERKSHTLKSGGLVAFLLFGFFVIAQIIP